MKRLKVLITCGPTWAAIDDVRVISNLSSGQMGHLIAQEFIVKNAQVTMLEGPVTHAWSNKLVKVIKYNYFDELKKVLQDELRKKYDIIIHAAAVSDFKVEKVFKNKVNSNDPVTLKLIPNEKIIDNIKNNSPQSLLVGFKLEPGLKTTNIVQETNGLFENSKCDLVLANSLNNGYQGFIIDHNRQILYKANSKNKLARSLVKLAKEYLEKI